MIQDAVALHNIPSCFSLAPLITPNHATVTSHPISLLRPLPYAFRAFHNPRYLSFHPFLSAATVQTPAACLAPPNRPCSSSAQQLSLTPAASALSAAAKETSPPSFEVRWAQESEVDLLATLCARAFCEVEREGAWTRRGWLGGPVPFLGLLRWAQRCLSYVLTKRQLGARVRLMHGKGGKGGESGRAHHRVLVAADARSGALYGCVEVGLIDVGVLARYKGEAGRQKLLRPYVGNLAVIRKCRRIGIGSALAGACQEVAKEWGFGELYLHVEPENEAAVGLYKALGYDCQVRQPGLLILKKVLKNDTNDGVVGTPPDADNWKNAPVVEPRGLNPLEYLLLCLKSLRSEANS